jgi:hypothetical protein
MKTEDENNVSECGDISVCDDAANEKSSAHLSGGENKETDDNHDTIRYRQNIDEFRFTRDKHVIDHTKQELDALLENDSDVDKIGTKQQRAKINLRERKRMHDLNLAMEGLREVMPCANGPSMRKLSKIATLSLARNYIQMLTRSIEELKIMLDEAYRSQSVGPTLTRRRNDVTVHPYRQFVGIRSANVSGGMVNNFDSHYSLRFERHSNTSSSFIRNASTCAGHGCCTRNNDASIQRGLYHTPWSNSMS